MAAEEETDTLKLYWDHFFKAETGTYEKSTWLDLFLAEFLIRFNNGDNPKDLIKFCPVSGVVTLVGCELLCGIHRVTSSINTHYSAPLPSLEAPCSSKPAPAEAGENVDGEIKSEEARMGPSSLFTRINMQTSEEILRKYLLGGIAWRCLVLLKALGVEGLSCCRQLSSVLIWLFGELNIAHGTTGTDVTQTPKPTRTPIHQLFSNKIWSKQKPISGQTSKVNSAASSERGSVTGRSRHQNQIKYESLERKKRRFSRNTEQSSESADSNDDLQILNRSLAIKLSSPNDDFDYFNSTRSSNEYANDSYYDPFYTPRKTKPKAEDFMNDKHREIINSEITTFQFTLIITDLLQELCKAESSLTGSEGSQISMQCINFSLRNLCSLQFTSVPQPQQDRAQEVSKTKVALTELLMVSLDQVLIHSDLCAKLINNGILPMLLRILEDVISKCKQNKLQYQSRNLIKTESENLLNFVFGIAYSITAFFHCLLMQCRTVDKLREFTDQFKLYGECLKGGLLKETIELMIRIQVDEEEETVVLVKKLIETVGKLIIGMKRVRSEVIHSAACPRVRHKVCRQRVAAGMHHHHDILGEASTGIPMSSTCCISVLYGTLASLLTDEAVSAEGILRTKILKVMLNCGVCCCFSPGFLMESIVRLMLTHSSIASLCLQVLEHTVYRELGASILIAKVTDVLPCSICEPCDDKKDVGRKYCSHSISPIERKNVGSFLYHYNSLLQLDNHNNVLHATVGHLLRVTPKCRMEMKCELLFAVIYPTFIVAKHRYIIRKEESAYFLTVSCLNIFASLLNTVSFAEQFIQKGGLSYVLELVSLAEFSNQCCSILEIAIIVEIFKLVKENSEMTYFREMNSLPSVQMLFKSLTDMTDKCYKIYKLKLPADKFEELCDVTKERDMLAFMPPETQSRRLSTPQVIKGNFTKDSGVEESMEDHVEVLRSVCTFWKTCASLCVSSPLFREYMVGEPVFVDSYALLKLALQRVCGRDCAYAPPPAPAEMRALLKLTEALLTVQLSTADVTSGRSKETCCSLVRAALCRGGGAREGGGGVREGGGGVREGGAGLRALCEALVRVAATRPSLTHAMPRVTHAKVPPLLCASGGSSAECSSSEDSVAGPYASEHSEPYTSRPDEGYEADVEVGKLDLPFLYRTRKLSGSLSTLASDMQRGPCPASAECGEYHKGAGGSELAHPELCVIVVDILTQLIHKLVESRGSSGDSGSASWRLGVGVARAWCSRVGAALARARAAPPPLLRRLLAPQPAHLLANTDPELEDLQRSILELIHVLASQSIEPAELAAFLKLFTAERPPLGMLLGALHRLVAAATHNTPDCILTFPVDTDNPDAILSLSEDLKFVSVNNVTSQSHLAESCAKRLHESHIRAGIKSPWSAHAVRCGVEGAGWAPWLAGFALSAWLHTQHDARDDDTWVGGDELSDDLSDPEQTKKKSPKKETSCKPVELSHVLSVGHESLMFEVWLDTTTGMFTFRLSRPEPGLNRVVSEARVSSCLEPRQWTCVALNVKEQLYKRHIYIQVTLYVNGYECETVSLPVQGILVRKVTPTSVLAGSVRRAGAGGGGAYHLSGVQLYRAPCLHAYSALHLAAHGPDHACQVRCESPNFPLVLTPNILDADIDWDQVFEISSTTLRELHDNLLLTFSAHAPTIMNLYHQTVAMPTVFTGRVASSSLIASTASGVPATAGPGASIPETLFTTWVGGALPSRHKGVAPALYLLGGPDVLLYLYARVVELEGSAEEQALALGVLLRASRVDNRLHAQFYADDVPDMLLAVMAAPHAHVSHHLLKVILDAACSAPVLAACAGGVLLQARTEAVLLQPALLVLLTRAWRYLDTEQVVTWEVEGGAREPQRGSAWALLLSATRALLRDGHPRRAFNHYQMERLDLLRHLLTACKERFLNSKCGPLDPVASSSLVEVVRGLVGAPPSLQRLAMLCDFLLLMHQASDTFVTHSRANFYFLLTPETQEMSDFMTNSTKRRPSRKVKKRMEERPRVSSASADETVNQNSLNALKEMTQSRDEDRIDSSGSTDSTKQIKSMINLQIQEGRKHTASSTSDNSDTAIEDKKSITDSEGASRGSTKDSEVLKDNTSSKEVKVEELNEYIVVDVDDINHTTVEMYTSGIYHQRRVRAGAEVGWSACEGLLLLLRHALALLPDHAHQQAVCSAVCAESLVVLSNQRVGRCRAAAVRALGALTRRAAPELARRLRASHYYVHLANQISLYEGSWELASACAALLTKCDVPLEDQLDDDIWVDVREEALARSPPLLALLPASLADVPLAHNICLLFRRIIDKASLKMLSEISLAEVVVRSIRAVGQMADTTFEGRDLLLEDLFDLLNRVAIKALASQHSMQTISELHHMLSYVEWSGEAGGAGGGVRRVARGAQVALYRAQLDALEDRLLAAANTTKQHNYFTTVLTSAVSLGGEGARSERGEQAARHASTVARAVSFLLTHSPRDTLHEDKLLFERLLSTLLLGVGGGSGGASGGLARWWAGAGAEWGVLLAELFWWAGSPAPGVRALQPALLRALYLAPPHVLHALTPHEPALMRKLGIYLLTMLKHIHLAGSLELAITDWARSWAVSVQGGLAERLQSDELAPEAAALLQLAELRWARHAQAARPHVAKVVWRADALASKVTESAMSVTRGVVDVQNQQRKSFMEHLRRAHATHARAAHAWQRLLDTYTHEQGVWHDPGSYPRSWQLDPTEGPGRVRVRLRRAHLHIPPKFLKHDQRHEAVSSSVGGGGAGPLRGVLGDWGSLRGGLVARLQLNETVSYTARVTLVSVACELDGELLLSDRCLHFVPERAVERPPRDRLYIPEVQARAAAASWPLEAVVQVSTRRWCLQERAVELFLASGHAQLLAFADCTERAAFLKALAASLHPPPRVEPDTLNEAMAAWRSGSITNWEYLMRLNGLGGRTYNDLMQYPVLPFVIADYTSRILDLNDPASFRDLSKPMAVQNKNREQHYINIYNDLKAARREGCSPLLLRQPHHYASLYSNSGGVLHYLVRLPPFTELFLNYQDNNFDMPDRTFHSLATTWRLITNDSPTDVKELIPELFYLPELFHNNEGLNLGVRQCGSGVDSVELPPWALDARLFTLVHRQALECAHVTEHLPHWIDLVFGYKQTGQPAYDAINVFPACTYYGFSPMALEDSLERTAAAAMVRTYGQAPRQLLRAPHPHAAPDLHAPPPPQEPGVWAGVAGLRWGYWCGSPELGPPGVVARRSCPGAAALHALPHARSVAVLPANTALLQLQGEPLSSSAQNNGQQPLALLSWGHADNIIRLKRRRDARPDLLLHIPALDQITCVASSYGASPCPYPLVLGYVSGRVAGVRVRTLGGGSALRVRTVRLHAHTRPVSALAACARAALLVTASTDGTIVLWDLNNLTYIRTLPNRNMLSVTNVAISETLCDVASVHDMASSHVPTEPSANDVGADTDADVYEKDAAYKYKSLIRVHTVNAKFVGSVKVLEQVTCACYSNRPEGVSVNCVAAGLGSGGVRLYSSWDLRPLRYVPPPDEPNPLRSVSFSSDSGLLFAVYASGLALAWESCAPGTRPQPRPVRILPAHALF